MAKSEDQWICVNGSLQFCQKSLKAHSLVVSLKSLRLGLSPFYSVLFIAPCTDWIQIRIKC